MRQKIGFVCTEQLTGVRVARTRGAGFLLEAAWMLWLSACSAYKGGRVIKGIPGVRFRNLWQRIQGRVLGMSAASKYAPRYTIEDYRLWQGDWEIWDGIAIAMTPSPFGTHQAILVALVSELRAALREEGCEATALVELDWIVSKETVVRPDVIVVCGAAPEQHLEQARADRRDSFAIHATQRFDLQTRSLRLSGSWHVFDRRSRCQDNRATVAQAGRQLRINRRVDSPGSDPLR